ncbi:PepSY domain-containing protein [Shinella pollutisoli]|uniref:PepSY domain-containing protein n=1 Tax=Shinella pollutisoli TaxID=2250594 RepID=A0ABV7DHM3_9HYPH|nr:PepSY domain-containing protein [Shinella pollutisoli]
MIRRLSSPLSVTLAVLLALGAAPSVDANTDDDAQEHEEARQALEQGLVRPLEEVIAEARKHVEGDLIEIELERENGRYIYELEFIQPTGQIIELQIDAKTMAIVEDDGD